MSRRPGRRGCVWWLCAAAAGVLCNGAAASGDFNESGGERQVLKFNDAGGSLGMAAPAGYGGFAVNRNFLRGFENESALRNGYRDFGYLGGESDAGREGVEVFKGPASALYGNGKPGGDLNVLTLRPDGKRRRDAQWGLERYGYRSLRADLGGTAGRDGDVAVRLGALAEGGPGRRRFDDIESYGLAPAIAWRLSADTRISLEADALKVNDQVAPDRLALAPLVAFPERGTLGERGDRLDERGHTWRLALEHRDGSRWRVRQALFVQRYRAWTDATELDVYGMTGDDVLTSDGQAVRRVAVRRRESAASEVAQTEWYTQIETPSVRHELLAGVELGRYRASTSGRMAPLASLDLDAPHYGAEPGEFVSDVDRQDSSRTQVAYLQDRLAIGPRWRALVALRAERVQAWSDNHLDGERYQGEHTLLSPRVGLVYETGPRLSWFASWTQSSRPQLGQATARGDLLPPEKSRQLEFGVQWGQADEGLMGTLSFFQLDKRDLATVDPSHPGFSLPGGERRSRGIELDLRGHPWPGAQLDASIEWLRAEVVKDSGVPPGTALPGVAPWFATAWLTQTFKAHWTAGLGLVGEGRRRANLPPDELRLPSYFMLDLSLAYRADGWRAQLTLGNALARRALISDGYSVDVAEPRSLALSLSSSF